MFFYFEIQQKVFMRKILLCLSVFVLALMTSEGLTAKVDGQRERECLFFKRIDTSPLTGRVVTVDDPEYNVDRLSWNLYFSRYPLAIVFAQTKQDIQNALNFCYNNKLTFRIRGGGHALEGWSSIDGGIIIDLREMTGISVNKKKRLAYVQPGVKQAQAVVALAEYGFAIPTGLEQTPGIAGVTLGGGIGLSIREYGLACDHLVEVEMILASGKVVRARKNNKYKDLFYACQGGGGGNFGCVTEFVYSVIPRGNVTYFKIEYPYESLETVVDAWQHWAPFQPKRLNTFMELFSQRNFDISGIYSGHKNELLKLLAPMLELPGSNLTNLRTVPYVDSWLFFAEDVSPPTNDKFSSTFVYKFLPSEAIHTIKEALDNPVNLNANFWFLALGGVMKDISKTATPFWNRDALFYFEWDQSWSNDNPEQAGPSFAWVENLRSSLNPFIQGSYVNVPDMNIPNWEEEYYGRNFAKLKEIKKKYDPNNFFTYEIQAIQPQGGRNNHPCQR
jgi:FAD binding domain/Berberine and berberine like